MGNDFPIEPRGHPVQAVDVDFAVLAADGPLHLGRVRRPAVFRLEGGNDGLVGAGLVDETAVGGGKPLADVAHSECLKGSDGLGVLSGHRHPGCCARVVQRQAEGACPGSARLPAIC